MTAAKPATPLDLDQFKGHTPGPWRIARMEGGRKITVVNQHGGLVSYLDCFPHQAELIAAAPALLAECKRQREQIAALREALEQYTEVVESVNDPSSFEPKVRDAGLHARAALAATQEPQP